MLTKLYVKATTALENFNKDERGVTAIEYALIGVAMATIVGAAFVSTGEIYTGLESAMDTIGAALK